MGGPYGYEDEQQKADGDVSWGPSMEDNPFQVKPRVEELPPLPDVNKKPQLGEHSGSRPGKKQVDEKELDWRAYVQPKDPGNTLASLKMTGGSQPEAPNTNQGRLDPGIRSMAWESFQDKTEDAASMRAGVAPDFENFMAGSKNKDLEALGFTIPPGFQGDASAFADKQDVAGGTQLGSLFNKQGGANLLVDDQEGIANAKSARETTGAAKPAHDATVSADHALRSKMDAFKSAEEGVAEGFHGLEEAKLNIERVALTKEVAEDKEALEAAKGKAEDTKAFMEMVFGGVLKYLATGPEEIVDAVESIGTMASWAMGRVSNGSIEQAEAKLKADTVKLQGVEAKQAAEGFEKAKAIMRGRVHALKSAREAVLAELGTRKAAYQAAGVASGKASGGSAATQNKLAALVAAVPAAEAMTGLIKSLVAKTAHKPTYESQAGMGFNMAVHAGRPEATNFVTALSQMEFVHARFQALDTQWSTRLRSLQKVREQLGGVRPDANDRAEKSHKASDE